MSLPRLEPASPQGDGSAGVVLVLHGGRPDGQQDAGGFLLSHVRMVPFGQAIARAGASRGVETALLRYRVRGWNARDDAAGIPDPVRDARWALDDVRGRHGPDVRIVLVGHSMGARAALRVGGDENVVGVAALAPWIGRHEPTGHLRGQTLLVAHGDRERMTDPRASLWFAGRVAEISDHVARFEVLGDGHAMLRRAGDWHGLVARFAMAALGLEPFDDAVANAMAAGAPEGLSVPLSR
ncbi:alpha/beta fold hydrolase [Actinomycetospora endophytica]|uniref:Alpha/beta fold hydrolase n=1 Tax=Actinomycetospora endophytica TaxID=2291215 RepID=A0ABS8PF38_9PSEU|nr:alpha/beta fold hydrolase [Actinomycetospora endophytica]MCD2196875.1 alpha/beta fold hydrolase [Actinomycetospora endophytica]